MTASFPTDLPNVKTNFDENTSVAYEFQNEQGEEINAIAAKVGKDGSEVTTSHDYKLSGVTGTDKAVSKTGTETLTNKTLISPAITGGTMTSPAITTPTGIVKGDIGLGNVDNTSDATKNSATATLTNKTLTSPKINEDVALTSTATELNALDGQTGGWTAYTPTLTNITLGAGTKGGWYVTIGKTVHMVFGLQFAADTSVSGVIGVSLPVTAANSYEGGIADALDSGTAWVPLFLQKATTTRLDIYAFNSSGTYLSTTATSSSVPFTWTTNDEIHFYFTYQAA
jgi:hypothetical protein